MDQTPDIKIIRGILDNRNRVIQKVYDDYFPMVERMVINSGGDNEQAKDIFQESLIIIYKKLSNGELTLTCKFSTYLYAVCKKLWLVEKRKKNLRMKQIPGEHIMVEDSEPVIDDVYDRIRALYYKHFNQLSKDCQKLLLLHFNEVPIEEMQKIMNYQNPHYVMDRKYRCKKSLIRRIINLYKMNIPNNFDLYLENKLSSSEKKKFERDLREQPELADSYKSYFQINRILKDEISSSILIYDDDPILKELNISQRLAIEEDFILYGGNITNQPHDNSSMPNPDILYDQSCSKDFQAPLTKMNFTKDETKFRQILYKVRENKSQGIFRVLRPYIGLAAAFAILFFVGKIIFEINIGVFKRISPQQAYALFYKPSKDTELKSFSLEDQRLRNIILDYKRTNLSSASILSNQMEVSDEDYELSLLFLGLIKMERNDFSEAHKCFSRILSYENPFKINTVSFYQALSYLAEGNVIEAYPYLTKLSKSKNTYRKKAKAILRSLKQS